jgi:hypothetical protein
MGGVKNILSLIMQQLSTSENCIRARNSNIPPLSTIHRSVFLGGMRDCATSWSILFFLYRNWLICSVRGIWRTCLSASNWFFFFYLDSPPHILLVLAPLMVCCSVFTEGFYYHIISDCHLSLLTHTVAQWDDLATTCYLLWPMAWVLYGDLCHDQPHQYVSFFLNTGRVLKDPKTALIINWLITTTYKDCEPRSRLNQAKLLVVSHMLSRSTRPWARALPRPLI